MALAKSDQWHSRKAEALGDEVMSIMKSSAPPGMVQVGAASLPAKGTRTSKAFSSREKPKGCSLSIAGKEAFGVQRGDLMPP